MRRRQFVAACATVVLPCWPALGAESDRASRRSGFLRFGAPPKSKIEAFEDGLWKPYQTTMTSLARSISSYVALAFRTLTLARHGCQQAGETADPA
jgi:hypothetical protein